MEKGFLHLHVTAVSLFLILYAIKTFLLLMNKTEQLDKLRAKTKIADMVLGSVMLLTGVYLLFKVPSVQAYHIVKIIVALASIPVGIIAFKKRNKAMAAILLVLFIYVFAVAKTGSLTFSRAKIEIPADKNQVDSVSNANANDILKQNQDAVLARGLQIYNAAECASCHGLDGTMGVSGAKDLTKSTLSHAEKVTMITNGKGLMAPFKGRLTEEEIEAVATYVDSMKK
jgi:uncharacterized membrane protein SirB2